MAPPDQGSGTGATPEAVAAALKTTEMPCTCGREEPMRQQQQQRHERKLSSNASFSSPTASPASSYASTTSTNYLPASKKLSCESIPYAGADDLGKLSSSFSSTSSSYESFFHIEGEALDSDFGPACIGGRAADAAADSAEFVDFDEDGPTATRPPAVQTMKPQKSRQRAEGGAAAAAANDPKRLPSSMFRTRSTNPAEWSATSNESLFSIQHSSSGDLTAQYADFYYDAAGAPRFPSLGRGRDAALRLPFSSQSSGGSGGLCVRQDCARCGSGGNKTRKSVRFAAATESVSGEGKHSVVVSTLAVEETTETDAPAASATKEAPAAGWCELGCCLGSSSPTGWWPRCCGCQGCGCHCKWWF